MVPTLDSRISLEALYAAILFTLIRLRLDPRLQPFVPAFEQAVEMWWAVYEKERSLVDNQLLADAKVDHADADLRRTSDGVAGTALIETKNNRKSALFARYFGTQQPNRFRRSSLGVKLPVMRTWPPSLKESANPTLKAYGETLETQVAAADAAVTMVSDAEQELTDFRTFGERQQLFDEVNGLRKALYGDVSRLVHAHPEWSLGRAYVNALFEHESAKPELSDADIDRKLASLNAEAAKLMALREQRAKDAEEEARERAQAEKKAKLAFLEAAEKEAAVALAKLAAAKAHVGEIDP
jgi:hypothetical protein